MKEISGNYMWNKVKKKWCGVDPGLVLVHDYFIWKVPIFLSPARRGDSNWQT